jgi:hypothetical protein
MKRLLFVLLLLVSACGSENDPPGETDAGMTELDGSQGTLAFGAECTADEACMTGMICRNFNMLGTVCTFACTAPSECPSGSEGQKCNMNGLCRP